MPTEPKTLRKLKTPKPRRSRAKSILNQHQIERFIALLETSRILSSPDRLELVAELNRSPYAFTIQDRTKPVGKRGRKKMGFMSEHFRDSFREHVAEYALALHAENPSIRTKASLKEAIAWAKHRYPTFEISDSSLYEAIAKFRGKHGAPRPLDTVKGGRGRASDEIRELLDDPDFNPDDLLSESEREKQERDRHVVQLTSLCISIGERIANAHVQEITAEFDRLFQGLALRHDLATKADLRRMLYDSAFDTFFRRIERRLEERFATSIGDV